jgi:hypothetical protein
MQEVKLMVEAFQKLNVIVRKKTPTGLEPGFMQIEHHVMKEVRGFASQGDR